MKLYAEQTTSSPRQSLNLPFAHRPRETVRETTVQTDALLGGLTDAQLEAGKASSGPIALDEFIWKNLDDAPGLLQESFQLRYEAYCERQKFLDASEYPERYERDQFDRNSLHVGIIHDQTQVMTATARIVYGKSQFDAPPLPLYEHCSVDRKYQNFLDKTRYVGEISRFVMSPAALDRILEFTSREQEGPVGQGPSSKYRVSLPAILTLYKSIYQASRINGIAVLVAAMEQSLRRLVTRFRFPFHQIGPEVDYFGPVAPFLLDLDELDDVLFDEAPWLLAEFYRGLEDYNPQTVWITEHAGSEAGQLLADAAA